MVVLAPGGIRRIALAGNPNAGKTSLFNALTGLRQKVANYPGVTVERKTGPARTPNGQVEVIDLPGTYSLVPASPDEQVAADVLAGRRADTPAPDVIVAVADATNLARNLFLISQLAELRKPMVVALTMVDLAETQGAPVDADALSAALGVPVVPVVSHRHRGIAELLAAVDKATEPTIHWTVDPEDAARDAVLADIAGRYRWIDHVVAGCVRPHAVGDRPASERIDAVLMHPVFGLGVFALVMTLLFFVIFTVAGPLNEGMEGAVQLLGGKVTGLLEDGLLKDLLANGLFAGVGAVVVFVPQIALLFLCLGLLEDSGYLARAAFLMDRVLAKVGLHGKSFIPLLSSHACAIPGILSTRTIESPRERLTTILVAPFMSCSARLPVYLLLIETFFAASSFWVRGLLMLGCYVLGIAAAAGTAWALSRTRAAGRPSTFILELPTYQWPKIANVLLPTWQHTRAFLVRAGTIIFALSVLIWAISTFPRPSEQTIATATAQAEVSWQSSGAAAAASATIDDGHGAMRPLTADEIAARRQAQVDAAIGSAAIAGSIAGRLGHAIEPVVAPLGFDWKMGVGLIGSFAAREVFVSTMGIVYSVGDPGDDTAPLAQAMTSDRRPDGTVVWTPLVAVSMLVWFVLAMQCISTTAVVRREAGAWKWPLLQIAYMNSLAWVCCFAVFQIGRLFTGG
jgi:ferrous iron transport protein B